MGTVKGVDSSSNPTRILLTNIDAIILKKGEMTTGRRTLPLPQLKCSGGVGCNGLYNVDSIICKNQGSDGIDVQWECETNLPDGVKFADSEVNCEGYDYPEDQYVLVGSCNVQYSLKDEFIGSQSSNGSGGNIVVIGDTNVKRRSSLGGFVVGVLSLIVLLICCNSGGGSGGGGGPGFWTGLGVGLLGGNAFRSRGGYRRRRRGGWGASRGISTGGFSRGARRGTRSTKTFARTTRR